MLIFYVLLVGVVYLAWCDFSLDPTKEQQVCIKFCASLGKSAMRTLAWLDRHSGKKASAIRGCLNGLSKLTETEKARQVKRKIKSTIIIFWHQGDCSQKKNSPGRSNSQSTYFWDVLWQMCEDFTLHFGEKRTGCCIMTMHQLMLPFSLGNSWLKTIWLSSPTHPNCLAWPPATFLFPLLKIKLENHHFDTIEVIEAES
jgi:hypothetical protein